MHDNKRVAVKAIQCTAVESEHPQNDIFILSYKIFSQHPWSPTGFITIMLHVLAKERGEGATSARLYRKNVCPLYRCPRVELLARVNRGETGYAGLSFSFSCTNDVVLGHSCFFVAGVQVGATLDYTRPGAEECQKQDGRRGDRAQRRRWNKYPHKIQLPELPQSWTQYSVENFPSTPGHQHK